MGIDRKALFHLVLSLLPGHLGQAISSVEQAVTAPGATKKDKAVGTAIGALKTLNAVSEQVANHPKFQAAVADANDALVKAANVAQQIHDGAQL